RGGRVADGRDERDAVLAGELQIGEDEVERLAAEAVERILGGGRGRDQVAFGTEELRHRGEELRVVVYHQDVGLDFLDGWGRNRLFAVHVASVLTCKQLARHGFAISKRQGKLEQPRHCAGSAQSFFCSPL